MCKPILKYPCNLEQYFLNNVLTVHFAVVVDVQLNRHLPKLKYSSECLANEIEELKSGLLLLKHLQHVLTEEILHSGQALVEPMLSETRRELINIFK